MNVAMLLLKADYSSETMAIKILMTNGGCQALLSRQDLLDQYINLY